MADSYSEEEGATSPLSSLLPHSSSTLHQEDIQCRLEEALNSNKVKDDEITRLTHLLNSQKSDLESYKEKIQADEKKIHELKLSFECANMTIQTQKDALQLAKQLHDESLTTCSCPKSLSVEQQRNRYEGVLKRKDFELEILKKEIATKDATISELQKGFSTPMRNKRTRKNVWKYPTEESSPVVLRSSTVDIVDLSSEHGDDVEEVEVNKNSVDFVEELLQDSCPSTTNQNSDSDKSEDDDDESEDSYSDPDDQDYKPNPNWYRNKIVKKLKGKRKAKPAKQIEAKRTTTSTGIFECPVCPFREDGTRKIYSGVTGLNYHMSINHPDHPGFNTERFQCSDCPEIFVRKADLLKHLRSAHLEVRYKCKYCTKSFTSAYYCYNHQKLHENTGGGPAVLTCTKCSKVFTSELGLKQHMVTRHPLGVGTYKCKHCNRPFEQLKALRLHLTVQHRSKHLKCPHCPKTYTKRGGLRKHILSHSADSNDVKPEVSGVGRVGGGLRHSREAKRQLQQHLESKGFSQELGNQSLNDSVSSVMAEFIPRNISEITLDGTVETICEYCGMEFGSNHGRQLKIHLSRHRFKCVKCVDMFDQPSSLRYHLSVTHKIDGEEAEELVRKGVQPVESQTAATKSEPVLGIDLDLDELIN